MDNIEKKMIQVTTWNERLKPLKFAIEQLEKYGTKPIIEYKHETARPFAIFRRGTVKRLSTALGEKNIFNFED